MSKTDQMRVGAERAIGSFFHCAKCMGEIPQGISPKEWSRLEVGLTKFGLQVFCIRHNCNVVHIDFCDHKVKAYAGDR